MFGYVMLYCKRWSSLRTFGFGYETRGGGGRRDSNDIQWPRFKERQCNLTLVKECV